MRISTKLGLLFLLTTLASAQEEMAVKVPSVTLLPTGLTSVPGGKPGTVELRFRVPRGFHINSNTPKSEFLIPTALKLDAPTDIIVGKITYPPGRDMAFPFSPNEKLNVYTGDFALQVVVRPLHNVIPGKYMFRGELKYQACDNAACYPPKKLPVQFEVKIAKAPSPPRSNPAQSPHVHR
jgi:Disulphide bond corrector protein DsbC